MRPPVRQSSTGHGVYRPQQGNMRHTDRRTYTPGAQVSPAQGSAAYRVQQTDRFSASSKIHHAVKLLFKILDAAT